MRVARALLVLLCASTLIVAATGCGSSGKKYPGAKPATWATQVCGALRDWASGLQTDSVKLRSELQTARDIQTVKAKFIAFLNRARTGAGTMVSRVQSAGPPAVKGGVQLQRNLLAGLQKAKASFDNAVKRAQALPVSNSQTFKSAVTALGSDVQKELTSAGRAFSSLGSKDKRLDQATSQEPACKSLAAR